MIKKWKSLSKLDCVKEFGLGHKIGHFLGIHMVSRCTMAWGRIIARGIEKSLIGRD